MVRRGEQACRTLERAALHWRPRPTLANERRDMPMSKRCRAARASERGGERGRAGGEHANKHCLWSHEPVRLSTREYSVQPGALRSPQPAHRRAPVRRPPLPVSTLVPAPVRRPPLPREYSSTRPRPPSAPPREYCSTHCRPPSAVVGYLVSWHARATRPQLHGDSVTRSSDEADGERPLRSDRM